MIELSCRSAARICIPLLACLALFAASCGSPPTPGGIAPRGGRPMRAFHMSVNPMYLQTDPRWSEQKLGGSGERFGSVGCVICSMSMALAQLGVTIRPDSLNQALDAAGGFTERGWLKWETVEKVTNGRAEVDVINDPAHTQIDEALEEGHPVLAKVLIGRDIQHWVMIAGKDDLEYLIKDPLGDGELEMLSKYGSNIHAIRIVSPARDWSGLP